MPDPTLDSVALEELLETVGDDREFLAELIETYLGDSPGLFEELRAGLTTGDAVAVRRAAHTLKSTSASFGATRLAGICREMETSAGAADLADLPPRLAAAEAEFEAVAAALRVVADQGSSGVGAS
jgi:HPt (histidine-containing phosphotransfer) domain-containing protein